jgi:hypothetical protein
MRTPPFGRNFLKPLLCEFSERSGFTRVRKTRTEPSGHIESPGYDFVFDLPAARLPLASIFPIIVYTERHSDTLRAGMAGPEASNRQKQPFPLGSISKSIPYRFESSLSGASGHVAGSPRSIADFRAPIRISRRAPMRLKPLALSSLPSLIQ